VIEPIRSVWNYRGFILGSVRREFQAKYRNSLLGAAWSVLNPLAMILIYTVIFSQVMKAKMPGVDSTFSFGIYICAGVLTWQFFAEVVGRSQTIFIENANMLKKLSFPRLCLPAIVVLGSALNFGIVFALFTVFLISTGNFPGWSYFALFPLLVIQVAFSIGLGVSLGVLNVFFRDVGQAFGVFLQFWFWLTPIVYPVTILPEFAQRLLVLNPMADLVQGYQQIIVRGEFPDWTKMSVPLLAAVVLCLFGYRLFRQRSGEMIDEL
jgi:lipopolysaccharide transport system permease protein